MRFKEIALAITFSILPGCDMERDNDIVGEGRASVLANDEISDEDAAAIESEEKPSGLVSAPRPNQAGEGWRPVCAASLTLKSAPGGGGGYLGTLYNGYWFYKTGTNGAWSGGYSNELGLWGWVLSQYLC